MVFEGDKKEAGTQTENIKKVYTEDTATNERRIPNTHKKRVSKPNAHKLVKQNNSTNGKFVYQEVNKKNNILILGDSNAIDFATILRDMCNDEYSVTSFIKHNALLDQILEGVINLTKDYGRKDYVIIMGGLVNMMKGVDAHESVTDILKQISLYTNIIVLSVPLWRNRIVLNSFIDKHNIKMHYELCLNNGNNKSVTFLNVNSILNSKSFFVRKILSIKYHGKVLVGEHIKNIIYEQSMTNKQLIPICSTKAIMPQNETENMESTDETQNLLEINEESSHNQSKASHYNDL
ncbi:hypothetical protein JTB14_023081 [Gonioctena quinquepunctata]|nr:hypothetical protein JTB14_023081 [Gonioctena quinquepunctata]